LLLLLLLHDLAAVRFVMAAAFSLMPELAGTGSCRF